MVVVTGATGHIGNVLVRELLKRGEKVRVLVRRQASLLPIEGLDVERIEGDICDKESLKKAFAGAAKVYHLAAIISILPRVDKELESANIQGTKNVSETCLEMGIKMIYTSSVHAIANRPKGEALTEETPIEEAQALGRYGQTKAVATNIVRDLIKNKGLQCVIVHPAGVIGPNDFLPSQMGTVFSAMIDWMFLGMSGEYNFVDVRDIVQGILLADEKGKIGERYILSAHIASVKEMKKAVDKALKRPHWYIPMPGFLARIGAFFAEPLYAPLGIRPILTKESLDILNSNADLRNEKAKKELGWTVRPFQESVNDIVPWILENRKLWKVTKHKI